MKCTALAIVLVFASAIALAQTPEAAKPGDVSKPKCEPKPEYPGRLGMQVESKRKVFDRDMKSYTECMKAYIEDRKVAIKANETAASNAVDEYNGVMTKIRKDQEAAQQN